MGNTPAKQKCKNHAYNPLEYTFNAKVKVKDASTNKVISEYPINIITSFLKSSAFKKELTSTLNMSSGFRGNITYEYEISISKLDVIKHKTNLQIQVKCNITKRPNRKTTICLNLQDVKDHIAFALQEKSYRGTTPSHKPINGMFWLLIK